LASPACHFFSFTFFLLFSDILGGSRGDARGPAAPELPDNWLLLLLLLLLCRHSPNAPVVLAWPDRALRS
jgi:hypothetical protein